MRLRNSPFVADLRRAWEYLEAPCVALLVFIGLCSALYLLLNFYPEV